MHTADEPVDRGEQAYDAYIQLFEDRIILLETEIDDDIASNFIAQLLFLEAEDPLQDIYLHINSPGGSVTAGMAIYDTIQLIEPDVVTVCIGLAGGMAGFLLATGTRGKRFSLPNAQIILYPTSGGTQGQTVDIEMQERESLYLKNIINDRLLAHTGQTLAKIQADVDRKLYLSPSDAVKYGLIDRIVDNIDRITIDR
jgi:ATP-dependent Clp protease, protease subunit